MIEKIRNFTNGELKTIISALNKMSGLQFINHPDYDCTMEHWYESIVSEYEQRDLNPKWYNI
jgi:hypothetical protein